MPPREYWETTGTTMPYTREYWETTNTAMPETHLAINANDLYLVTNEDITDEMGDVNIADITFVTKTELDTFAKRIYHIVADHTKIDISEDEFMDILKGENNE